MGPSPHHPFDGVFFDLSARAKIRVTGEDRHRYVNGQITNDLRKVTEQNAIAACILTAKGKTDAYVFIAQDGESFVLDADSELRETLPVRLERYVIADDVQVADVTNELSIFHVIGANAPEVPGGKIIAANRFGVSGFDIRIERSQHQRVQTLLAGILPFLNAEEAEVFRIEQGIPEWGRDLTPEIIPVEANLEESCVDYEKGCYIGQEVISRMKMSGQRSKRLCGYVAEDESKLISGARLTSADGKEAGWLTSAADSERLGRRIALGYIKRGFDAPAGLTVVDLPFSREAYGK